MITFIAEYPQNNNREGMAQRIKDIDNMFVDYQRQYIHISTFSNLKFEKAEIQNLTIYKANCFLHRKKIKRILQDSECIYVQTIYNFKNLSPYKRIIKEKTVFLDFHGIVPEEIEFQGKKLWSLFFGYIEKVAVKYSNYIVFVTNSMKNYVKKKYSDENYKELIYPIIQDQVLNDNIDADKLKRYKEELGIENEVVVLYSGNCQKWQNVDLMFECIKKNQHPEVKYIILTGDLENMNKMVGQNALKDEVIVKSVAPDELPYYYSLADYGFILRDDIALNRVACPTKLIEYLYYDMIPIVKCEKMGDFCDCGYNYIYYESVKANQLKKKQRYINRNVILQLMQYKTKNEIRSAVDEVMR